MLKRTFETILSTLKKEGVKNVQEFGGIPGIYADLSYSALQQLYKNPDPRIKRIRLNKGAYGPLLNISTSNLMMNMPVAWGSNSSPTQIRGAGQTIVIMDSAVEKNHPFLSGKVVAEACFGTTGTILNPRTNVNEIFKTICPSPDPTTGDSPIGLAGSADSAICLPVPIDNENHPNYPLRDLCNHGTYVAGIAAGKYEWPSSLGTLLTGVAPEAKIIAVSIMSRQMIGTQTLRLWGSYLDLVKAMGELDDYLGFNSPTTVSLSVGDGIVNGGTCDGENIEFQTYVSNLASKHVPVIAATGNEGSTTGILWPACTPQVIKVGGTMLNGSNEVFWNGSNMIDPMSVPSETFFLAPACVYASAVGGGTGGGQSEINCGTSASTPHVAGIYALAKEVLPSDYTVPQITSWISLGDTFTKLTDVHNYKVKRIRLKQ